MQLGYSEFIKMPKRPRELKIENPAAIELLLSEKSFSMLQAFALKPTSLGEAAELKNISMSRYLYWVKKFIKLGLLVVAKEKGRAGSSIKYYWIPAEKLSIGLHNKPQILEKYFLRLLQAQNKATVYSIVESVKGTGLQLSIDIRVMANNSFNSMIVNHKETTTTTLRHEFLKTDASPIVAACRGLNLEFKDAKSLQAELWKLLDKYEKKSDTKQQNYYFSMTLAPELD